MTDGRPGSLPFNKYNMKPYKRINEDYLDKIDIQTDDVDMKDDIISEIDAWLSGDAELSFNPCLLPDGFYKCAGFNK